MNKKKKMKKLTVKTNTVSVNIQQTTSRQVVKKKWHSLQISLEFHVFVNKTTIVFKTNKNLRDLIGCHLIRDGKVANKKLENRQGKSKTCNTTKSALCCMEVVNNNTLK